MCPYSQDDELDTLPLVDLHIGIRKLTNNFFPRDIHTHKMLEKEETTTVNVSVLDFKGAMSVEWNGDCPDENREQDVLYLEKFVVVGSWQEGKYQGALVICIGGEGRQTKNWYSE